MKEWLRESLARRPTWMNVLLIFSAYKATEPLHWAIYALGTYGFWRMRSWMWPWASVYVGQVAIGMLVWPILYRGGLAGFAMGAAAFVLFGALAVALWRARDRFQAPRAPLAERYGGWAVVTGASAGLGTEFARAFARGGLPVVLTARREDRLKELAGELAREYGVETRVVSADLAAEDGAQRLAEAVADLDVGVLVNNAGFGYAGRFDKQDAERLRCMVQVNCVAPVVLTARLLPALKLRGRGAVIVVGSIAGHQPLPLHGVYAATKAFDQFFGEALWAELRGSGIDVLVLEPGSTATEFHDVAGEVPHPGAPPEAVVRTALDALGQQPSVIHGWFDWLRANAARRLLPRSLLALIAKDVVAQQTPPEMR
jgi:short-subunit dehydrogenase